MQDIPKGNVQIGKHTSGIPFIMSYSKTDRVIIGKFCSIAAGVVMIPSVGHVPPEGLWNFRVSTYPLARLRRKGWQSQYSLPNEGKGNFVLVGNDVWIGARAIILSGVRIGDGAIVGAGAVVSRDVPPYAVVAGVPAKIVKFRYANDKVEKLLRIGWWNWSEKKILANMDYFHGDVGVFVEKFFKQ
jgi:acetyltransferase-like isoleucine patch superfamily enzyme